MRIEDRIQNIKKLLKYCPHSTSDVLLDDDTLAEFFGKFINNDDRFEHCIYCEKIYPKISLAKHVLTRDKNDNVIDEYPIMISYIYDSDRDGVDWVDYYFDDKLVRNNWMFKDGMSCKELIKFEEIPDNIWEIIQNILYDKAMKTINEELKSAKESVKFWEDKKHSFESVLNLKR